MPCSTRLDSIPLRPALLDRRQLLQVADELRQFPPRLGLAPAATCLPTWAPSNSPSPSRLQHPEDRLVWDVGHQCYAHKVLTGRRPGMDRLRMASGVSAFPSARESPYDTFGVGHSSTSISAALGMALAINTKARTERPWPSSATAPCRPAWRSRP